MYGLTVYYDRDYLYEACGYVCLFYHELAFKHIFICNMYIVFFCMYIFLIYDGLEINKQCSIEFLKIRSNARNTLGGAQLQNQNCLVSDSQRHGARPTNGISIEFEIRSKFGVL